MKCHKTEDGVLIFTCEKCGRIYDMHNEWHQINLDAHECWIEVGA